MPTHADQRFFQIRPSCRRHPRKAPQRLQDDNHVPTLPPPLLLTAAAAAACAVAPSFACAAEKTSVTIAVGGKNLYYYLPMAIADWMGFFKDEGLDVKVVDFQGGSRSLQAVIGGSARRGLGRLRAYALDADEAPGHARLRAAGPRAPGRDGGQQPQDEGLQVVADLKGKRIGVTAPGSSSHVIANYVLATAGIKPNEVSVIGIGFGRGRHRRRPFRAG